MKKDFGVHPFLFPMPTYMVVTYNEDETVDAMAMAWGGICAENMVALNLEEDHKTVANLKARGAFTLSVPGRDTLAESDFMGIASANQIPEKFSVTGLHAEKSSRVDAPIITEYPLTLECKVVEMQDQPYGLRVLGEIVNVLAAERPGIPALPSSRRHVTADSYLLVSYPILEKPRAFGIFLNAQGFSFFIWQK